MLQGSKGPVIQIDRLIFDTRNETKKNSIIPDKSSSSIISNIPSNSSDKTKKEDISNESHFIFPSDKLKIFRLTMENSNNDGQKIYSLDRRPSTISEKQMKQKNEDILSPVYESIDGRRYSIDLLKKQTKTYDDQFQILL